MPAILPVSTIVYAPVETVRGPAISIHVRSCLPNAPPGESFGRAPPFQLM